MLIDASFNAVTGTIISSAIAVHRAFGPGLLESAYVEALRFELAARNVRFASERELPLMYRGHRLGTTYRVDLIVDDRVVVEVKCATTLLPVHQAQVLTYMRLTGCPAGLLINFNVTKLTDGVKRLLNPQHPSVLRASDDTPPADSRK
jgi:GxxExxY protein